MAVVRCDRGHFFDDEKFDACPHCASPLPPARRGIGMQQTVARASDAQVADRALAQKQLVEFVSTAGKKDEKTVGVFRTGKGMDPVVGWLVCVEGGERGRDYRLHAGRNFVGRAMNMDIALMDDERISRDNHCSIVYEPVKAAFMLVAGTGDGLTVDGERVAESVRLFGDERIEIGSSVFVFVPFCRGDRSW